MIIQKYQVIKLKLHIELVSCLSTLLYYNLDILNGVDYHVFLGGTDVEQEQTWLWTDGSQGINYNCFW